MTHEMIYVDKQDYLGLLFKESAKEEKSRRTRTTIWDVLADLGGTLEIVILSVPFILGSYRKFKFDSDLLA